MLEIQSAVLLVTAVIWSLGMCMTPGDLRAAVIPEPLTPALHDFLEGGWGENSGLQKNPNVQLEKYLHSQFRACLALWWGSIGCRDAQSEEQPFWSTVQLCCTQGHFDFCLFPAVSAVQNQTLRRNLSKAVKHCFQGPLEELSPPQCCWSGRAVQ